MRCIDADTLKNRLTALVRGGTNLNYCIADMIDRAITIEPERKKGEWRRRLVDCGFNADWHCSRCGWKTSLEEHGYNFCPNCGADMRGSDHE